MSSTNRGAARAELDFYETPSWCTRALLERERFGPSILDPCCGTGAILRELPGNAWGIELDHQRADVSRAAGLVAQQADFLDKNGLGGFRPAAVLPSQQPDAVVMNPPYSLAREFILRALEVVKDDGKVAALLRLNFLGSSRKRLDVVGHGSGLFRVWVLARRPSFTGDKKTDSCDYAWCVYRKGYGGSAFLEVVNP